MEVNEQTDLANFFHEFDVINRKTGKTIRLTGIGTKEHAEYNIRNFNLAGVDFENDYELRYAN